MFVTITAPLQTDSIWPELLAGTVHCFVADLSLLPLELIMNRLHLQVSTFPELYEAKSRIGTYVQLCASTAIIYCGQSRLHEIGSHT